MTCKLLGINSIDEAKRYVLTEEDWKAIDELTAKKYKNWDWNYGESPQYSDYCDGRFKAGTIQVYLEVEQGRITKCSIRGDFFSKRENSRCRNSIDWRSYGRRRY